VSGQPISPDRIDVTKEVDFSVSREDWTRFKLSDGTILRIRIVNFKIVRVGESDIGMPMYGGTSQNIVSSIVPSELIDKQGQKLVGEATPEQIKEGTKLDFELIGKQQWQEYRTTDGWTVLIRPEVGMVVRLKYYNQFGEPVYWANIQPVYSIKKA
jgi:hypothetical protein